MPSALGARDFLEVKASTSRVIIPRSVNILKTSFPAERFRLQDGQTAEQVAEHDEGDERKNFDQCLFHKNPLSVNHSCYLFIVIYFLKIVILFSYDVFLNLTLKHRHLKFFPVKSMKNIIK